MAWKGCGARFVKRISAMAILLAQVAPIAWQLWRIMMESDFFILRREAFNTQSCWFEII